MPSNHIQETAERLINQLQANEAPWQRNWRPGRPFMPRNPVTEKPYRGINAISLASIAIERGYDDPRWLTAQQAEKVGARVVSNEPPATVQYWKFEDRVPGPNGTERLVRLEKPRMFEAQVFNANQIEGLPALENGIVPMNERIQRVGAIARGSGAAFVQDANGGPARYDRAQNAIYTGRRDERDNPHRTHIEVVRGLAAWTGHPERLGRDIDNPIGSTGHAREELRCDLAAMMLGDRLGIGWLPDRPAAHTHQWIDMLKKDPAEIFRASMSAELIAQNVISMGRERNPELSQERMQELAKQATQAPERERENPTRRPMPEHWTERAAAQAGLSRDDQKRAQELYHELGRVDWSWSDGRASPEAIWREGARMEKTIESLQVFAQASPEHQSVASLIFDQITPEQVQRPDWHIPQERRPATLRQPSIAESASRIAEPEPSIAQDFPSVAQFDTNHLPAGANDGVHLLRKPIDAAKIIRDIEADLDREAAERRAQQIEPPTLVTEGHPAMSQKSPERIYLAVPYEEKDQAKGLGAKWDSQQKVWFIPAGTDPQPFTAWIPADGKVHIATDRDPREQFAQVLRDAGFKLGRGDPVMDGKVHRLPVEGDRGQKSGAYRAHMDGRPAGWFQNHKTDQEPVKWKANAAIVNSLSPRERAELAAEAAQHRAESAKQREGQYQRAAERANAIWNNATEATTHPYLEAKGVPSHGLRIAGPNETIEVPAKRDSNKTHHINISGRLLIPIRDITDRIISLQIIDAQPTNEKEGKQSFRKMFLPESSVAGGHMVIGDKGRNSPWPEHISTGYATSATVHEATGLPVVVAFSDHNLGLVAAQRRALNPDRRLYIDGDNDHMKPLEKDANGFPKKNVGKERALEVAATVPGAHAILPQFPKGSRGTDWNDLAQEQGIDAVRKQLRDGVSIAHRKTVERESFRDRISTLAKSLTRGREQHSHSLSR